MAAPESPLDRIRRELEQLPEWIGQQSDEGCGAIAIELQEFRDRSEANSAEALRRFEKSGGWAADGSLNMVSWLRTHGKLSGGAAIERVTIARQLAQLPETEKAVRRGDLGYEHGAILSSSAARRRRCRAAGRIDAARGGDDNGSGPVFCGHERVRAPVGRRRGLARNDRAFSRRYFHLRAGLPAAAPARMDGVGAMP